MSEWLDIMLEEIARKKQEAEVAETEQQERASATTPEKPAAPEPQPD